MAESPFQAMTALLIVFLIFFLFCMAFFSAVETALFSLSPLTIKAYKKSNDQRQVLIAKLLEEPTDLLVTVMMLIIFSSILVQNTVSNLFPSLHSWMYKVGIPLSLTLIFGEMLPKSYAILNNVLVARFSAPWIFRVTRLLKPIRYGLIAITNQIVRVFFLFFRKEQEISSEELRHVLRTSKKTGVLLPKECELISGALDLQHVSVAERMRPRDEIVFYDIKESLYHARQKPWNVDLAKASSVSNSMSFSERGIQYLIHLFVDLEIARIPVCDGSLDCLLGIISAKSFFFHQDRIKKSTDLLPILKKPYYVPETIRSSVLLKNLRDKSENMAIVVDEYGSVSGLISQEDLIETVIGEISDRRDEKILYTRSGSNAIIASGKLELSVFQDIFNTSLSFHENAVTLGGWLIQQLGDIPSTGTKYANDDFLFYILAADPNRIRRVYVRRLKS